MNKTNSISRYLSLIIITSITLLQLLSFDFDLFFISFNTIKFKSKLQVLKYLEQFATK